MTREELLEMPLKQVCGLVSAYKREAINILINAEVEDMKHEVVSYYETEKERKSLLKR